MMSSKRFFKKKKQQCLMTNFFAGGRDDANNNTSSSSLTTVGSAMKRPRIATTGSSFGGCPLCNRSFPLHRLEAHASECTGIIGVSHPTQTEEVNKDATNTTKKIQPPMAPAPEIITPEQPQQQRQHQKENSQQLARNFLKPKKIENQIMPDEEPLPGLLVFYDFISPEEEQTLLDFLDQEGRWKFSKFNGNNVGKRWGVHCNLRDRRVDAPEIPLPDVLHDIVFPKLARISQMKGCVPNEANSIDYRRKQGHWLHPHVDDRKLSKEPIANLSLAGDCTMTFRNQAQHRNLAVAEYKNYLPRRCLQILTGSARYDFSHGISHSDLASDRRVSITMRESPLTGTTKTETFYTSVSATPSVQKLWKGSDK
jgi:alkylated DNA repair dioxygenase AlkB